MDAASGARAECQRRRSRWGPNGQPGTEQSKPAEPPRNTDNATNDAAHDDSSWNHDTDDSADTGWHDGRNGPKGHERSVRQAGHRLGTHTSDLEWHGDNPSDHPRYRHRYHRSTHHHAAADAREHDARDESPRAWSPDVRRGYRRASDIADRTRNVPHLSRATSDPDMAFALNPTRPIRRALQHVVRKTLRHAGEDLQHDPESAVHAVRKRVKQVRAIVEVLHQTDTDSFDKDARRLRGAGQRLSILRDADAVIATFDHLRARFPTRLPEHTYAIVRRQLVRAKARIMRDARADQGLAHVAHTLHAVCRSMKRWRVPAIEVLQWPALLKESYRASRTAMRRAHEEMSPSELHRWRKRVKTLWYQLQVAELLAPGLRHEMRRFNQLQTWLGEDHDLYVMQETIADDIRLHQMPAAVRALAAMSSAVQTALRRKSFTLGKRLLADRPKAFTRRLRRAFLPSLAPRSALPQ